MAERQDVPLSGKFLASQIVATIGLNLIITDSVMSLSISTLIIPVMLKSKGKLRFTEDEASWFASAYLIAQPIGSIISGLLLQHMGRKLSLILFNICHVLTWIAIYHTGTVTSLYVWYIILGFGTGFMEAPMISYLGEITHPSLRGKLLTATQMSGYFGLLLMYCLGNLVHWRTAALLSMIIPLLSLLLSFFVPESPIWLITKGRQEEAQRSLCWLSGWAKPHEVQREFEHLLEYHKKSTTCKHCCDGCRIEDCVHKQTTIRQRIVYLIEDLVHIETRRPLLLTIFGFFCLHITGEVAIRPNLINILYCFGIEIDPYLTTALIGFFGVFGAISILILLKYVGKRPMMLFSQIVCASCTFCLGTYAYMYIDHNTQSYNIKTIPKNPHHAWFPLIVFLIYNLISPGVLSIPWLIMSEVFPLRQKGVACGISAAAAYGIGASMVKCHYILEKTLGIFGVYWFYSGGTLFGLLGLYLYLPETEGKSFEEIEEAFVGKDRKIIPDNWLVNKLFKCR